jgi:putative phosphoribosyl transferase
MKTKPGSSECAVDISIGAQHLRGDLCVLPGSSGIVLFAHGSGSSRRSPRNQYVARVIRDQGCATLLFDLLSPVEEEEDIETVAYRFDIGFLTRRLVEATRWVESQPWAENFRIGYFGSSAGGAAALVAAATLGRRIGAVVSRGGRPDLADQFLPQVQSPTRLIVGARDTDVLRMNREALAQLRCEKDLKIVPGATHLFEEAGALPQVAHLAAEWFKVHLASTVRSAASTTGPR